MSSQIGTAVQDRNSTSAQTFFKARQDLIASEKLQRSGKFFLSSPPVISLTNSHPDHAFRQTLSPTARKACDIVAGIRANEHSTIWSTSKDSELEKQELFPGMIFNLAKEHMETTQLWRIVQRMPKGALLHCHMGAMVDLEWVFETAIETQGICICSPVPLISEEVRGKADVRMMFLRTGEEDGTSIWTKQYTPGTWVHMKSAADSFPDGVRRGFVKWLQGRCTIGQEDNVAHHLGVDAIWRKLQGAFKMISMIELYEPITRKYLQKFFATLVEDRVRWVEMRAMSRTFRLEGEDEPAERRLDLVRVIGEEIEKFMATEAGKGLWGARIIWGSLRYFGSDYIVEGLNIRNPGMLYQELTTKQI